MSKPKVILHIHPTEFACEKDFTEREAICRPLPHHRVTHRWLYVKRFHVIHYFMHPKSETSLLNGLKIDELRCCCVVDAVFLDTFVFPKMRHIARKKSVLLSKLFEE